MADIALTIPSANPTNYHQAISDPDAMECQDLWAKLFLPDGPGPFPVVIVVPGSLGLQPHHLAPASALTDLGVNAIRVGVAMCSSTTAGLPSPVASGRALSARISLCNSSQGPRRAAGTTAMPS